jgi:hypothetical protein
VLARGRERFLVQCKQRRARQVSVSVMRELYGVMAAERVTGGYVVTSGTTKDAKEFAAGRNIELIDGQALEALLRDGRSAAPGRNVRRSVTRRKGVDFSNLWECHGSGCRHRLDPVAATRVQSCNGRLSSNLLPTVGER